MAYASASLPRADLIDFFSYVEREKTGPSRHFFSLADIEKRKKDTHSILVFDVSGKIDGAFHSFPSRVYIYAELMLFLRRERNNRLLRFNTANNISRPKKRAQTFDVYT
jgi:hypothetical protein